MLLEVSVPPVLLAQVGKTVPLRPLDRGTQSQVEEARQAVVRTDEEWVVFWDRHTPKRPRPPVDFSREMVVGVFLGSQPTAGFGVEIVSAAIAGDTMVVRYRSSRPADDAIVAQMVTSPYNLVAVPRHSGEVRLEKTE
jgi:hypothetical protein